MNSRSLARAQNDESPCERLHGMDVEDPFRWLEDRDSPATRSFVQREQWCYRDYLDRHKTLRSRIERRVRELLNISTIDLPVSDHRGGLLYLKREAHEEQKAICSMDKAGAETLLLSVEKLGRDSSTSLAIVQVSPYGHYLAFGIRTGGEDVQEIGIYDLENQRLLPDKLARGFCRGLVFDQNQNGFYYVHEETEGCYLHRRAVRWHEFDTDSRDDSEVFHAGEGPSLRLIVQGAEDASALGYLIVSLDSIPETRFLLHAFPLNAHPHEIIRLSGVSLGPRISARTIEAGTTQGAPHGRIVRIQPADPRPEAWTSIIPEMDECLASWERWEDARVVHYAAGSSKLTRIFSGSGELIRTIEYPMVGTTTLGQVDSNAHRLFYAHSDVCDPPTIYTVDLRTGDREIWWRQSTSTPPPALEIENHSFRSKDGIDIPITLIHQKGSGGGVRPFLLSAYGGGGASTTSKFSVLLTILAEAGFTCATAHVRGGGEGGLNWHLAAKKQRKQTSVDDLIGAAEWLIERGYTTSDLLGIAGQSAGGLLVLCALTQRPHLFRAALALGPLADLTRFHLFGVARGFVEELGSPEDPEEFAALYRLSPYHHVRKDAQYSAVLIISGDRDKRCDSLHARKMIAMLKSATSQNHPILLDYSEIRGHKPVLPLTERIRALTDRLTFLMAELCAETTEAQPS